MWIQKISNNIKRKVGDNGMSENQKVWVILEKYGDSNVLLGITTDEENRDKIIENHFKKYGTDVGNVWYEQIELNKLEEYDIVYGG